MMKSGIKQYDVWLADLAPGFGTEPGKTRPVVIVQTDMLNNVGHLSTIICPLTTRVFSDTRFLRVHLSSKEAGTLKPSDILVDQIRSVDNRRLINKIGSVNKNSAKLLRENLAIIFGG